MNIQTVEELQNEVRKIFDRWLDLPSAVDEAGSLQDWIGNELSEFLPIGLEFSVGYTAVFGAEKSAVSSVVITGTSYLRLDCTFFWNDEDFEVEFDVKH